MIRTLTDRVAVKKTEVETKTTSGIIIPDSATEKPLTGEVVAIGKKVEELKVGDKVFFGKFAGSEVKVGDDTYTILVESEVLAVLE